jgi:hypothetical protein
MDRHFVHVEDGTCVVDGDDGALTIGSVDAVVTAVGGEEYVLEYDDAAASTPWLSTDADGTLTVEVRRAIEELPLPEAVYDELSDRPGETDGADSERVRYFAAVLTAIWDSKGGVDPDALADVEAS